MMARRKKEFSEPKDFGTPEMAQRLKVVPSLASPNNWVGRVMDETMIDQLLLEDRISPSHHATLEHMMRLLVKANFVGVRSPSYDAPLSADPSIVGDRRANQIRAIVALFRRLDEKIGPAKRQALVNLVLHDREWPEKDDLLIGCIVALDKIFAPNQKERQMSSRAKSSKRLVSASM